jgi:hypothetical protein
VCLSRPFGVVNRVYLFLCHSVLFRGITPTPL